MAPSTTAGIITAIATVIIAVGGLISSLGVLWPILRHTRAVRKEVQEVHIMVNQQRTDALRYQEALIRALQASGIDIPIDQSIPPVEEDPS